MCDISSNVASLGDRKSTNSLDISMNPMTRNITRVRLDDAVEADSIFTILMGDLVPPRRKFIEDNALTVANLDI